MNTNRSQQTYWKIKTAKEQELADLIIDTLESRNLYGWSVIFSRAKNTAGTCSEATKEITISRRIVEADWNEAVKTAMHEVAHAIAGYAAGHELAWQKVATELGADPKPSVKFKDTFDEGKSTKVSTAYGMVQIVLGSTKFFSKSNSKTLTVTQVRRGQVIGADEDGKLFRSLSDELHPCYGDPLKIIPRKVFAKTHRGATHVIVLGESSLVHEGKTYYALRTMSKNAYGVASDGSIVQATATMFKKH